MGNDQARYEFEGLEFILRPLFTWVDLEIVGKATEQLRPLPSQHWDDARTLIQSKEIWSDEMSLDAYAGVMDSFEKPQYDFFRFKQCNGLSSPWIEESFFDVDDYKCLLHGECSSRTLPSGKKVDTRYFIEIISPRLDEGVALVADGDSRIIARWIF